MTSSVVGCPSGVALLISDPVHAGAIRALWTTAAATPKDLDVADWTDYGRAWLTAQTVRIDLLSLLQTIWSETWGTALRHSFPEARHLPQAELFVAGVDDSANDDILTWVTDGDNLGDHAFFVATALPGGGTLQTEIWVDSAFRPGLWFGSESVEIRPAPAAWLPYDDTGYTLNGTIPIKADGLDIQPLKDAARQAVELLGRR